MPIHIATRLFFCKNMHVYNRLHFFFACTQNDDDLWLKMSIPTHTGVIAKGSRRLLQCL